MKRTIFNLLISLVLVFGIILSSKGAFLALFLSFFLFRERLLGLKFLWHETLFLILTILVGLYFFVFSFVFSGVGIGSFFNRVDIFISALITFFNQNLIVIFFGHGLGYTWYGNSHFLKLYSESTADFGMFMNSLLQGGIISFLLFCFFCFSLLKIKSFSKFQVVNPSTIYLNSISIFLVSSVFSLMFLTNYDIIFWIFIFLAFREKLSST
jgi:hypothetical protein